MDTTRAFIAFKVPDEVKDELFRIQTELKKLNPRAGVRWSEVNDAHVTVVFLGEIAEDMIEDIKKILAEILTKYSRLDLRLGNIDAFPNRLAPKAIVVKVEDGAGEGGKIQAELAKELRGLGLEIEDKKFNPHLTLGRNKFGDKIVGLDKINVEKIFWQVESVELIKSDLFPSGPQYSILWSHRLGGN